MLQATRLRTLRALRALRAGARVDCAGNARRPRVDDEQRQAHSTPASRRWEEHSRTVGNEDRHPGRVRGTGYCGDRSLLSHRAHRLDQQPQHWPFEHLPGGSAPVHSPGNDVALRQQLVDWRCHQPRGFTAITKRQPPLGLWSAAPHQGRHQDATRIGGQRIARGRERAGPRTAA